MHFQQNSEEHSGYCKNNKNKSLIQITALGKIKSTAP